MSGRAGRWPLAASSWPWRRCCRGPAMAYVRTTTESGQAVRLAEPEDHGASCTARNPPPYLTHDKLLNAVPAVRRHLELPAGGLHQHDADGGRAGRGRGGRSPTTSSTASPSAGRSGGKMPCDPGKESCAPYDSRALAITSVFALEEQRHHPGRGHGAERRHYKWADVAADGTTVGMPGEKVHDLQNTVTHEFGHLIGLDHNCYRPVGRAAAAPGPHGCGGAHCNEASAEHAGGDHVQLGLAPGHRQARPDRRRHPGGLRGLPRRARRPMGAGGERRRRTRRGDGARSGGAASGCAAGGLGALAAGRAGAGGWRSAGRGAGR